jgi:outer membrane protein assembly factor BamB
MPVSDLQDILRIGLTVVSELWHYTAKNWVTTVAAADIDADGDIEILTGSRDGRVRVLTSSGDLRWERVIGSKAWVGTLAAFPHESATVARMLVGNRDGLLFALDKDGKTVSLDGKLYNFDRTGFAVEPEREQAAFWLKSAQVIRQVLITPASSTTASMIVASSEDRCVYALDAESGKPLWTFSTQGPVRAICAGDVNGDGEPEILAGSGDRHLYLLNSQGRCLQHLCFESQQIYTLQVADVDRDGQVEILVGTDAKDLLALNPDLSHKWSRSFPNRLLCLLVADLDGDGHNEIVAGCEDKHLYILDQQGNPLWRHHLGATAFSLYALDFDHDGQMEVLVGSEHNQVHAFRIHFVRQLSRKILRLYQTQGKPSLESLSVLLPAERDLLQDLLEEEHKQHPISRPATIEHARHLCDIGEVLPALVELLRMQQQRVQQRWSKEMPGHVRALYLGDISGDPKLEVVIGTADGTIQAFNTIGRELWHLSLGGQILALQTGYLDQGRWQETLACSSDHHIYVISGTKKSIKRRMPIDQWMSSFYLLAPDRRSTPTVVVGTEDSKLCFYDNDLSTPRRTIHTPQGIKIVYAYDATQTPHPPGEQVPEVIAGGLENRVYAYTRQGRFLWDYPTQDRVLTIAIKDLDGDGRVEIIIGSEDRNVHVLSNDGLLKWRYFLEHRVIAVDACDLNGDGHMEVLAGCGDGKLYVLSAQGEPLWNYQANDRIRVVRAEDIDADGYVEIALGSEDRLELLRVVDQAEVSERIDWCWQQLVQERPAHEVIGSLLAHPSPLARAFALRRFAEQPALTANDLALLEAFVKEDAHPIRHALCYAVMRHYSADPALAHQMLNQLSMAQDRRARLAFVEQLSVLMQHHWDLGMEFLERFLRNRDRFVRRAVIRQIYQLLPTAPKKSFDSFFQLLLQGLNDDDSIWIHQEAARTLALLLDRHEQQLVGYLYNLITNCKSSDVLRYVADYALDPRIRHLFHALSRQLSELNATNALDLVEQALSAWSEVRMLPYGQDAWLLTNEFAYLLSLRTIEDIAHYQCRLHLNQFTPENEYAPIALHILDHLATITRLLSIYLHHNTTQDQLNCLLEAITSIDEILAYVQRQYTGTILGETLSRLPDRMLFEIILKRWHTIMKAKSRELSGRSDLKVTLLTPTPRREEEVGILLLLSNVGRGAANNVKITLLDSADFTVIGARSHETRTLLPQEETLPEFIIRPRSPHSSLLDLAFQTAYHDDLNDGDGDTRPAINYLHNKYVLELTAPPQQFRFISNPYSTGTPTPNMFYGRAQDIAYLQDNLTRPEAKSVIVLYGQRRSGKTTLLRHLVESSILGEHIPVIIDMQAEEYKITISQFLLHVALHIYRAAQKRGIQLPRPDKSEFTSDPTFALNLFLDDVEALLGERKIILLIDEFEVLEMQVKKNQIEEEIFSYLRSLIQNRQNINFVFSGTHQIRQLTTGYWSVFFNIAHHYPLSHLDSRDAEALITRPVADYLEYEPHAVQKIRRLTGDQPYLIHLVCRSLVDLCNKKEKSYVTIHDVNIVQENVMQTGQFHFDWIWDQISSEEQFVLSAIAEGRKEEERLISLSEIEDLYRDYRIPFKRDSVLASIKTLIEFDVVAMVADDTQSSPERNRYRISVGLIGKWLRKEKSLELLGSTLNR